MIHSSPFKCLKINGNNKNRMIIKKMSNCCLFFSFYLAMDRPTSLNYMADGRIDCSPGYRRKDGFLEKGSSRDGGQACSRDD